MKRADDNNNNNNRSNKEENGKQQRKENVFWLINILVRMNLRQNKKDERIRKSMKMIEWEETKSRRWDQLRLNGASGATLKDILNKVNVQVTLTLIDIHSPSFLLFLQDH